MSSPPANKITRFTSAYCSLEDRIKITSVIDSSKIVVVWLNQRLLVRLFPHLFRWLDNQPKASRINENLQAENTRRPIPQNSAQQEVVATDSTRQWLVTSIDVKPQKDLFTIEFKGAEESTCSLALSTNELEQWIVILYRLWNASEWKNQAWPSWLIATTRKIPKDKKHYH